ncbi:MAG: hypothetical protein IJ876_05640 [Elusimicrobiaceae bacterium]|nr:hypothetical protein [Elusimicrobiaceae bacterium]
MVQESKIFQAWKRTEEDENVQLEMLFDALYEAGKVSEKDVDSILSSPYKLNKGYLMTRREAAWLFLRNHSDEKGDAFWDKMNCYNHSPIDLANQIYERTMRTVEHGNQGTATYTCTGAPAVMGIIVCMGKMQDGQYITNPKDGAPRQLINKVTPNDILVFLTKYGKWLKDPLLMFGLWRTYTKNSYGSWLMCLCHHLGTGRQEDFYEHSFDAEIDCIN